MDETPGSMMETVPVGFRFRPTDEELVGHYLKHKLLGHDSEVHNVISEIDICRFEPWELPGFSKVKSDDPEWYFFSRLGLKHTKGNKCNRATKAGYWKITGINRNIKKRGTNNVIGKKKTLVFHKGRSPHCVKTNWVIHEYYPLTLPDDKRNFVLCRLIEKAEKKEAGGTDVLRHDEVEPSSLITTNYENLMTADEIPNIYESPEANLESMFPEQFQAEVYDVVDQPPTLIEQESHSTGSKFPSPYFGNENSPMQFSIDSFLNSFSDDNDDLSTEDITHAFVNDTNPSQSSPKVHSENNEADADLLSPQDGNIIETTTSICNELTGSRENQDGNIIETTTSICSELTGSRENQVTLKVTSSHDARCAVPIPVSSKKENIFQMCTTLTFRLGEGNWAYDNEAGLFIFLGWLKIEEAISMVILAN